MARPTARRRPESKAMSRKRFWGELKASEFSELDPNATVAVLPVAAIEQHGPHLPVMTDTAIMQGMIDTVLTRLPDELAVLLLPIQTIGKSNEHLRSKGTITFSAENLLRIWFEIGEAVHRAGLRKLVIVNSHGGNAEVIGILARELNVDGAVGDASAGTAEKGRRTAEFQADGFIALLRDVARFSLDDWLSTTD